MVNIKTKVKKIIAIVVCMAMFLSLSIGVYSFDNDEWQNVKRVISLVYDDTGSMANNGQDYAYASYALQNFIGMMNENDQLDVVRVSDILKNNLIKINDYEARQKEIENVRRYKPTGKSTDFLAVDTAVQYLNDKKSLYGNDNSYKYYLIVITDGKFDNYPNNMPKYLKSVVNNFVGAYFKGIFITIGDECPSHYESDVLANDGYYFIKSNNNDDIVNALFKAHDIIYNRYTINEKDLSVRNGNSILSFYAEKNVKRVILYEQNQKVPVISISSKDIAMDKMLSFTGEKTVKSQISSYIVHSEKTNGAIPQGNVVFELGGAIDKSYDKLRVMVEYTDAEAIDETIKKQTEENKTENDSENNPSNDDNGNPQLEGEEGGKDGDNGNGPSDGDKGDGNGNGPSSGGGNGPSNGGNGPSSGGNNPTKGTVIDGDGNVVVDGNGPVVVIEPSDSHIIVETQPVDVDVIESRTIMENETIYESDIIRKVGPSCHRDSITGGCFRRGIGCYPSNIGCYPSNIGCYPSDLGCSLGFGRGPLGCTNTHLGCGRYLGDGLGCDRRGIWFGKRGITLKNWKPTPLINPNIPMEEGFIPSSQLRIPLLPFIILFLILGYLFKNRFDTRFHAFERKEGNILVDSGSMINTAGWTKFVPYMAERGLGNDLHIKAAKKKDRVIIEKKYLTSDMLLENQKFDITQDLQLFEDTNLTRMEGGKKITYVYRSHPNFEKDV